MGQFNSIVFLGGLTIVMSLAGPVIVMSQSGLAIGMPLSGLISNLRQFATQTSATKPATVMSLKKCCMHPSGCPELHLPRPSFYRRGCQAALGCFASWEAPARHLADPGDWALQDLTAEQCRPTLGGPSPDALGTSRCLK